jgi:hypothetical protein
VVFVAPVGGGDFIDMNGITRTIPEGEIVLGGEVTIMNNSDEGITSVGIRLLVKNQVNPEENGIYKITTIGNNTHSTFVDNNGDPTDLAYVPAAIGDSTCVLTRTADADSDDELTNAFTFVLYGEIQAANGYTCTGIPTTELGGSVTWTQFSATGNIRTRDGIKKDDISNTLDADVDSNGPHAAGNQTIIIRDDIDTAFAHNKHGGGKIALKNDGTIVLNVNDITLTTGQIDSVLSEVHIKTGNNLEVDNGSIFVNDGSGNHQLTLSPGSITDFSGKIDFGNENLTTEGTIRCATSDDVPGDADFKAGDFVTASGKPDAAGNLGVTMEDSTNNRHIMTGHNTVRGNTIHEGTYTLGSANQISSVNAGRINFNANNLEKITSAEIGGITIIGHYISRTEPADAATGIDFQDNALTSILSAEIGNCTYMADPVNPSNHKHELKNGADLVFRRFDMGTYNVNFNEGTCTAIGFTATSDERLKKNIDEIDNAVEKLESIRGVTYNWIDEKMGTESQLGFLAQEVEEVFPQMVGVGTDGMRSIDYSRMCSVLVQAVKEQQGEINNLKQVLSV